LKAKRIILFFLLLSALIPNQLIRADPGWLTGWNYRVQLNIDHNDIGSELVHFPVLVYISNSSGIGSDDVSFVFDRIGSSSLKMAATKSDGTTELYVEVERWDVANERGWIWVSKSDWVISNITDTVFYLYYDGDHVNNTNFVGIKGSAPAENVWNSDFKGVWHLDEDPSGTPPQIIDSTSGDHDGTSHGSMTSDDQVLTIIDGGLDFDGAYLTVETDWIEVSNHADLNPTSAITVEVWAKISPETTATNLVSKVVVGTNGYMMYMENNGQAFFFVYGLTATNSGGTGVLTIGDWYYLVGVYDGNFLRIYSQGIQENSDIATGSINVNSESLDFARYGANGAGSGQGWSGEEDEIRISSISRSSDWIKATYESSREHLIDFGVEETIILESPNSLFGAGFNASSPYVILYWKSNLTDITLFEVQNSTDKISWDYLGSNTTTEYHDFQVFNGTERYYKVRACNYTGSYWANSSFTDINFETVYFVMPIGNGVTTIPSLFPGLAFGIALFIIAAAYYYYQRR